MLEAPFTSTVDVAELHYPFLLSRLLMRDRFESDRWIGKVHMPVLIVHGDADTLIPDRHGPQRLYNLANPPKVFVAIPGGGHDDLPQRGFYAYVWRFLGMNAP